MRGTVLSLLIIAVLFYFLASKGNEKSPPYSGGYCKSIEEARDKGVFEFEVVPCRAPFTFDSGHGLKLKKAWLEKAWTSQVYVIGKTRITKEGRHHLVLIYEIVETNPVQNQNLYYFLGDRPVGDSLVHYNCERSDTINVPLYRQTSPILPPRKKRVAYDSLAFVRADMPLISYLQKSGSKASRLHAAYRCFLYNDALPTPCSPRIPSADVPPSNSFTMPQSAAV